jgi:hypothetical protein
LITTFPAKPLLILIGNENKKAPLTNSSGVKSNQNHMGIGFALPSALRSENQKAPLTNSSELDLT